MRGWVFLPALAMLALGAWLWLTPDSRLGEPDPTAEIVSFLGPNDDDGFRRARLPGEIQLPRDHGPHPDYRSEWWYFTGNLATAAGREFGFQLTFFRFALAATPMQRASAWATPQVYMAHLAVTDELAGEHRVVERLARGSLGLAGAQAVPFVVWLDDWSASSNGENFLPLRLRARDADTGIGLDLLLAAGKPPVLHGENGLSAKGRSPGNASWYYSYTRMLASGSVEFDGAVHELRGAAWLDREWSSSSLERGTVGWDWFGLQLDDGRELMLYALRRNDGTVAPQSAGSLVGADGAPVGLGAGDFRLRPIGYWISQVTGVRWPIAWRIRVPSAGLDLEVRAAVADQEQDLTVRYWEGAVNVLLPGGGPRVGQGYLELTGYRSPSANSAP